MDFTQEPAKFFYDTRRLNGRIKKRKETLNRSSRKFSKSDETLFGERVEKMSPRLRDKLKTIHSVDGRAEKSRFLRWKSGYRDAVSDNSNAVGAQLEHVDQTFS